MVVYDITVNYSGEDKYDPIQFNLTVTVKNSDEKPASQSADKVSSTANAALKGEVKSTGNPIFVLLLMLMTIGFTTRRFKK